MAYEKQTWISYDDNKTEEQNIQDGAVVTAERMNHIEQGLVEHEKDKENPHEVTAHQVGALTAEESSANVVNQVIGKENAKINITLDYQNKIAGSVVENPHKAAAGFSSSLPIPSNLIGEASQTAYDALSSTDGQLTSPNTTANKDLTYFAFVWDVLEWSKRELGTKFFSDRGAETDKQCVELIRSITEELTFNIDGYGHSPSGYKLSATVWDGVGNKWSPGVVSSEQNKVSQLQRVIAKATIPNFINDDGKVRVITYGDPSDGTIASTIKLDYTNLNLKLIISANDHIESKIATYYGKNIGNVDNYGTATQAEAEAGTATDKFMTPLRTKQHVSSRIASQTEAESGTATEKLMTPLRTKQHVDKRIATKAEAEAGTSETAIMTPKATKQAIEKIAANTSIARKSFTGVSTIETSERGKFNPDGAIISFKRTGNLVLFNAKLNHTGGMKWVTNIMSTGIPIGYRADKGFYETQFALPLNIEPPKQTGTTLKWSRYTIDDDNIFIYSDNTGNHFISGEWLTIDPFPEEDIV